MKCKLNSKFDIYLYSNGDDGIVPKLYFSGINGYESETAQVFIKFAKISNIIYDVGANTGYYSLLAGLFNSEQKKIIAFEPVPRIFNRLKKNININNTQITIEKMGVANFNGKAHLNIPDGALPSSSSLLDGFRPCNQKNKIDVIINIMFIIIYMKYISKFMLDKTNKKYYYDIIFLLKYISKYILYITLCLNIFLLCYIYYNGDEIYF